MSGEQQTFVKEAERCRRIAQSIGDAETAARLLELAHEYERRTGRASTKRSKSKRIAI
jgi:hypothetical protein